MKKSRGDSDVRSPVPTLCTLFVLTRVNVLPNTFDGEIGWLGMLLMRLGIASWDVI
jgi:hypothetical protein